MVVPIPMYNLIRINKVRHAFAVLKPAEFTADPIEL